MTNIPPPPKPPTPPPTRMVKDCGNSKPLTKTDWIRCISIVMLILFLIPPVLKMYLFWFAIWS